MEICCTRPNCPRPQNFFAEFDDLSNFKTIEQKYCIGCGMPLILAGRYIPSKLLGEGGFGRAFLARDRYTPGMRECVVKQFQPSGNLNTQELEVAQQLFEREATALEQLGNRHKQIPDLYAYFSLVVTSRLKGKQERFFYLVQEYIDGQTLEDELESKGQFSEAEIIELLEEILPVLQFVHNHGSIHRDIKPSNLIRSSSGLLYLLDFGAVKQVTTVKESQLGKSTGIFSVGFAPPEQKSGARVFPSTDLYTLAVTCINLLSGKSPEELYDPYTNTWQWQSSVPNISDRTIAILERMLLPTPRDRFQSAESILKAMQRSSPSKSASFPNSTNLNPTAPNSSVNVVPKRHDSPSFSLLELFSNAAFTGFESALLYFGLVSGLSALNVGLAISVGLWGAIVGGTIFAQYRRFIEKIDLLIIAGISLGVILLFPVLRGGLELNLIIGVAILSATAAIASIAIFRLVYNLISRLL
jgi:serine/threonine protein kinase